MRQILATLTLAPQGSTTPAARSSHTDHRGHALRLSVAGALDIATADALTAAVINALRLRVRLLVLDFDGVTFCDAAGVSALVSIHRAASGSGTRCVLTGLQPPVERILNLVGLGTILRFPAAEVDSSVTDHVGPARPSRVRADAIDPYQPSPLQAA